MVCPSLKDILLRYVATQIMKIGRFYRHNVDALKQCARFIHVLPPTLLQEIYEITCHEIDLESSHVALCLHSRLKRLDLDESIAITVGFDLQILLDCVGDNMKNLEYIRLPTGSKISPQVFEEFCKKIPNAQSIILYGVSITDSMLLNLARSPNIQCLNLSNTPITDVGIYNLCSQESQLRYSITHLYLSQTCVSDLGAMTALNTMCNLKELKFPGCIFQCLIKLHLPDFISNNIHNIPKYKLQVLQSKNYMQQINCTEKLASSALEMITILCPDVKKIKLVFYTLQSMFSSECLLHFVHFAHLNHLSIKFSPETDHGSTLELLFPMLKIIGPQLIRLKLCGISESTNSTFSTSSLSFPKLTLMTFIGSSVSPVKQATLLSFWNHCPLLETLTVRHCRYFNDEVLNLIVTQNRCNLKILSLTECKLSVVSLERLFNSSLPFEMVILLNCLNARDKQLIKSQISFASFYICIL